MNPIDQPLWMYNVRRKSQQGLSGKIFLVFYHSLRNQQHPSHKQTCPTVSSSYLQTTCFILFWSDYSYTPMHRLSPMAGRGTASHRVGKKPWGQETAGNLLSAVIPSTTAICISLTPTAEQDHTSKLISN